MARRWRRWRKVVGEVVWWRVVRRGGEEKEGESCLLANPHEC